MSAFFLKSKYLDKISISVGDLQNSSLPLIYQTEFSDYNLRIGDNILSQHWRQKTLKANFFSDKNGFRYINKFYHTHTTHHTHTHTPQSINQYQIKTKVYFSDDKF